MKIMIHVKSWCHLVACERAEMTAKVHCSPAKRPLRTRFSGAKISMRIQDLRGDHSHLRPPEEEHLASSFRAQNSALVPAGPAPCAASLAPELHGQFTRHVTR